MNLIKNLGFGLAVFPVILTNAQQKPNIVWIIADDLGPDLKCFGNNNVLTPNLDKLASEGIRFTQVHSVTPVCSPSRSSLMTGMYPVSINCHQHRTLNKVSLTADIIPITEYFRKAGYYVSNGDATKPGVRGKTDYNFQFSPKELFDGSDWIKRKVGQPFFAQMQIHFPHRPFLKDDTHPVNRENISIPPVYPEHPLTREDWALYLESVQHVDQYVGKVIERLNAEGLLQNTIVMFFGDQGRPMVRAKQFLYDEGTLTPMIIRFPDQKRAGEQVGDLISNVDIPATSLALAGISLPKYMQGLNIFSGKKREYVFCTRDRMDETIDKIRSVRSKRFKYILNYYPDRPYTQFNTYKTTMYPVLSLMKVMFIKGELSPEQAVFMKPDKTKEEFYDLIKDPFEMHNLAADPEYAAQLALHRKVLEKWITENDKGTYPESREETDYWAKDAGNAFQKKMTSYGLPVEISDEDFLKWWEKKLLIKEN
jgi:uncharacterized sulfatase